MPAAHLVSSKAHPGLALGIGEPGGCLERHLLEGRKN